MKQKEEQLSDAKKSLKALMTMPIHPDYKPVNDLPIPYHQGVLIRPIDPKEVKIKGIIISGGSNTIVMAEGIIYKVGPGCSDYIKVGTKCQFPAEVDSSTTADRDRVRYTRYFHKDIEYISVEYYSLIYAIPDPTTIIMGGTKSDKAMGREKRMERQKHTFKIEREQAAADKDKRSHKTKGKIRPVK